MVEETQLEPNRIQHKCHTIIQVLLLDVYLQPCMCVSERACPDPQKINEHDKASEESYLP